MSFSEKTFCRYNFRRNFKSNLSSNFKSDSKSNLGSNNKSNLRYNLILLAVTVLMPVLIVSFSAFSRSNVRDCDRYCESENKKNIADISASSPAPLAKPRLEAPRKNMPGYEYYTDKNIFYQCGMGMPNCTCYAYGRVYEILGKQPGLCPYDAGMWYDYNKENGIYPRGSTPQKGAVACWKFGDNGHVAVVEEIRGDKIIMSHSAWGGSYFYITGEDYNNPGEDGWDFQGYIYPV